MKYIYAQVKEIFEKAGFVLLNNTYKNCKEQLLYQDIDGYKYYTTLDHFVNRGHSARMCHSSNPYSIENINKFAEINSIESRCVEDKYIGAKTRMRFICGCGRTFYTTKENFFYLRKTKCDSCTGYNNNLTYQDVKNNLKKIGFVLDIKEEDFIGVTKCDLFCRDLEGYKYKVTYNAAMQGKFPDKFNSGNPFTIDNINHFLKLTDTPFQCISDKYVDSINPLEFICKRCDEHVFKAWRDINKNDNPNRYKIICPNCDGRTESVHALVLKQMFKHYYPNTIEEEKSCVNPLTGRILPTDIVNHRLKIAVEIQSEWHDREYQRIKDKIKKDFWLNKGYSFYDPDIRDFTILGMCQLFFDIKEIPDWVNFDYSNKWNIKKAQELLDKNLSPNDVAQKLNINVHNIYDAVAYGKLHYSETYIRKDYTPIVEVDENNNVISFFTTIKNGAEKYGLKSGSLASALLEGRHNFGGHIWYYANDIV